MKTAESILPSARAGAPDPDDGQVTAVSLTPRLKTRLQAHGVRVASADGTPIGRGIPGCRRGGAGPAEGVTLLWGDVAVNVPSEPSSLGRPSPFTWTPSAGGGTLRGEGWVVSARTRSADDFYARRTSDGVEYGQVALLHGTDCLASTVIQSCSFWGGREACGFCGIETSLREGRTLRRKTPGQLAEVARASLALGVRHVTLTSGSTRDGRDEIDHLVACTRAIVEATGLPVQVQVMSPSSADARRLREAGAVSIGIHAESLDPAVLAAVAPVKARLGWPRTLSTWRDAVAVFGPWQVTTFVIVGLGECVETTMSRMREVVEEGVYPHVVPFRPVPGARLAHLPPPDPETVERIYRDTAVLVAAAGGSWRRVGAG